MFSDPWGFFILNPFTNVLLLIYNLIGHNFGLAVILFTILIRAITWPLTGQQLKGAKVMQDLQSDKEWQDIQKKYAKDREKLASEQMRIYQERGVNPFASCLPTLIQFPIIIGLYQSVTRALAATPLTLLQLARSIYPIMNASAIIPLNSHFLWMDLGRPEGLAFPARVYAFLSALWFSHTCDRGRAYDLLANKINSSSIHESQRSDRGNE